MEIKRNRTLFSVCLLYSLILFGCTPESDPFTQKNICIHEHKGEERDPRLDGWWRSDSQDSLNPAVSTFYHFDVKKGTKTKYRNGAEDVENTEYWYTERNITEYTSYDGIIHTFFVGKNVTDWEHYYRIISNDILEISSEIIGWEQKLPTSWQTLNRIPKPEQFDLSAYVPKVNFLQQKSCNDKMIIITKS